MFFLDIRPHIEFPFFDVIDLGQSPPKTFTEEDKSKTLGSLGLVPRAKIVVQTTGGVKQGNALDGALLYARMGIFFYISL